MTRVSPQKSALNQGHIMLAHGGGGQLTDELIQNLILPRLGNSELDPLDDAAILNGNLALTIDSYVVDPWQFPGGDIGRLAVCGTVNDLAVSGAKPLGIALSLILTEGFGRSDLQTVLDSIQTAAGEAKVQIVTGDTKVVPGEGLYITTAGVGLVDPNRKLGVIHVKPGDKILINGPIAEHGLTVMLAREMPEVQSVLKTDAAPLNHLADLLLKAVPGLCFMRDATRSGLAGVGADLARDSGFHVVLDEASITVDPAVQHAADMLGLDPLEVANEGKMVVVVRPEDAQATLAVMREHPLGRQASLIGEITDQMDSVCELATLIGGRRIVQKPYGEQLPRIC